MDDNLMSIREIFEVIKKRWRVIVSITLAATLISVIVSFLVIKPKYEASTKFFIGKDNIEGEENQGYSQNDVLMYQQLMKTYSEIIRTHDIVLKAIENPKLNLSVNDVLDKLTVVAVDDTQILQIKFKSKDPNEAMEVIARLTDEFIKTSTDLVPNGNIKILDKAKLPTEPVSSIKALNILIVFLIGIIISLSVAFLLEFLDNTINDKKQLEMELDIPVIGEIPNADKNSKSFISEKYRALRINLQYLFLDNNLKTITVTSSDKGEGKTKVAVNLALSFGEEEKKILLIDADLRQPSIDKIFNLSNTSGLADILNGKGSFPASVHKYKKNMYILTAGNIPKNPEELLASSEMSDFLEWVKKEFAYIIIDTTPIEAFVDSRILSRKVDGTVLVVRAGKTKKESIQNAFKTLKHINSNIIGTVLNKVDVNEKIKN